MFQVEKKEFVNKTFRVPKDLSDELSKTAQNTGVSVNELVVQCCHYALNHLDNRTKNHK